MSQRKKTPRRRALPKAKKPSAKAKKPPAKAKKPPAKKAVPARAPRHAIATPPERNTAELNFMEELEAALGELRRLSTEVVSARRELLAEESTARGMEGSLRRELETLRTELKTARADLEIALANARRIESRLEAAAEAEARAREAQREAEHASDRARDELLWLRREVDRLGARGAATPPSDNGGDK